MRNLPLPSRESDRADLAKAIRTYHYKGETRGYTATPEDIEAIIALYDRYDADRGIACNQLRGDDFGEPLNLTLHRAYDLTQTRRKLGSLRQVLFTGIDLCPICGIGPAVELDHHLPRSIFRPLAIYARNLVPMCHACNHAKLAGFGEQDEGEILFLHAYFDTLPDLDFLRVDLEIQNGGLVVKFSIVDHPALPEGYADRLTFQMTELNLNARYVDEVNTYISSHAIALHISHRARGAEDVRRFLTLQARYETAAFYRNHWRPILLAGLAGHDAFVEGGFADVLPVPEEILADLGHTE